MTTTPQQSDLARIGRVMLVVADQQRALEFYRDVLGFEVRADFSFGSDSRWLEVGIPGAETVLTLNPPNNGLTPGGQTGISISVRDVDAVHARLVAAGADVDAEVARVGGPVPPRFDFRDPDGNVFDVAEEA